VERRTLRADPKAWLFLTTLAALSAAGCGPVRNTKVVPKAQLKAALEASPAQLIAEYNEVARGVHSVKATMDLAPTAGSSYTGVIQEYHNVKGFLLARRPGYVRLIGQAPVVAKDIFDMVSDGQTFYISIPSKKNFIVGPANLERPAKTPLENLRPQHLLDAIFWPEIPADSPPLFEEFSDDAARYYLLTVLRTARTVEIARKIWFDRSNLQITRLQTFGSAGRLISDVRYGDWQTKNDSPPSGPSSALPYPRHITLVRPHDDYRLELRITKLTLNEELSEAQFKLEQPPGSERVTLDPNKPATTPSPESDDEHDEQGDPL
jgi:outer membrane lipoprotein-sorting protein